MLPVSARAHKVQIKQTIPNVRHPDHMICAFQGRSGKEGSLEQSLGVGRVAALWIVHPGIDGDLIVSVCRALRAKDLDAGSIEEE